MLKTIITLIEWTHWKLQWKFIQTKQRLTDYIVRHTSISFFFLYSFSISLLTMMILLPLSLVWILSLHLHTCFFFPSLFYVHLISSFRRSISFSLSLKDTQTFSYNQPTIANHIQTIFNLLSSTSIKIIIDAWLRLHIACTFVLVCLHRSHGERQRFSWWIDLDCKRKRKTPF